MSESPNHPSPSVRPSGHGLAGPVLHGVALLLLVAMAITPGLGAAELGRWEPGQNPGASGAERALAPEVQRRLTKVHQAQAHKPVALAAGPGRPASGREAAAPPVDDAPASVAPPLQREALLALPPPAV